MLLTMKKRLYSSLGLSFLLAAMATAAPTASVPAPAAPASREMTVVIVDSLRQQRRGGFDDFDRMAEVFGRVFDRQHWPVKVTFERFAANNGSPDLELEVFYKGIQNEFDEQVFKAWTILNDHGTKHDFGIVEFRYQPRLGQNIDDMIQHIYAGAAEKTAALIQPYLVSPAQAPKP